MYVCMYVCMYVSLELSRLSPQYLKLTSIWFDHCHLFLGKKIFLKRTNDNKEIGSYPRKRHLVTFCSSGKQGKDGLTMFNSRLRTLECKPINGVVTAKSLTPCLKTGLEPACCHIFHPHKSRIMDLRWLVSMIDWSKHSHGSSTGITAAEGHVLAFLSDVLNFSSFDSWQSKYRGRFKFV